MHRDSGLVRGNRKVDRLASWVKTVPLLSSPYKARTTTYVNGALIQSDPVIAAAPGHAYLEMVAVLPIGVPADYEANTDDAFTDGVLQVYALNRRQYARPNSILRRPRTLLITGASFAAVREFVYLLGDELSMRHIDVLAAVNESVWNAILSPMASVLPITSSVSQTHGNLLKGPGAPTTTMKYLQHSILDLIEGGDLYVAHFNAERMQFGFSLGGVNNQNIVIPYDASSANAIGPEIYTLGYTFKVKTFWSNEVSVPGSALTGPFEDPGPQAFSGAVEVGSAEDPNWTHTGLISGPGRIQIFLNQARVNNDRAALQTGNFNKVKMVFWGQDDVTSDVIDGLDLTVEELNPGDPEATAALIDGGTGLVGYQSFSSLDDGEEIAVRLIADAIAFFDS